VKRESVRICRCPRRPLEAHVRSLSDWHNSGKSDRGVCERAPAPGNLSHKAECNSITPSLIITNPRQLTTSYAPPFPPGSANCATPSFPWLEQPRLLPHDQHHSRSPLASGTTHRPPTTRDGGIILATPHAPIPTPGVSHRRCCHP
jgi:hypothetical protein